MPHAVSVLSFPIVTTVFLASLVEFIEALTIVLAVAVVSGWRSSGAGAVGAIIVLAAIVAVAGPLLMRVDLRPLEGLAGVALVIFGARWLRKAILRAAGKLALHDEAKLFEKEVGALKDRPTDRRFGLDLSGAGTSFNGVLVEGLEVVFIVVAAGATAKHLAAASIGAAGALATVVVLGVGLRRPITQVPENTLKLLVAIMLCGLGVYWLGEAVGMPWPGGMWSSLALAGAFLLFALAAAAFIRRRSMVKA